MQKSWGAPYHIPTKAFNRDYIFLVDDKKPKIILKKKSISNFRQQSGLLTQVLR